MPTPTYRFRVQRANDERSQDWRVWIENAQIYLSPRSVGHQYKASFHSSGQCQVGLSSEIRRSLTADQKWAGKSRLFSSWQAPVSFSRDERVVLLELLFPGSYLDSVEAKAGKPVDLLPCPHGHLVSICLAKASLAEGVILSSPDNSFRELARLPCGNSCTLSVLYRTLPETDEYRDYLRNRYWSHYLARPTEAGRTFGSRPPAPISSAVRALLWDGRTEPRQWHEVSARKLYALGPQSTFPARESEA